MYVPYTIPQSFPSPQKQEELILRSTVLVLVLLNPRRFRQPLPKYGLVGRTS